MKYHNKPPVFAYIPKPRAKHSPERIAHDALFFAVKGFFDGLSDSQRDSLAGNPGMTYLQAAFDKSNALSAR